MRDGKALLFCGFHEENTVRGAEEIAPLDGTLPY
jgi:hypothetical protein